VQEEKDEEKSDEDDESSDEEDEKEAQTLPHFHSAIIPNYGGINRVKVRHSFVV
jgi:hypothetical protein